MNKKDLIKHIIQHLCVELETTELAAKNAHLAAIDDQSIAETQYDTIAIEAGYLAEGQSKRVQEIKHSIYLFEELDKKDCVSSDKVVIGSLVQLDSDKTNNKWFYLAPSAGGYKCEIEQNNIIVITPHSPMGKALINKEVEDDIILNVQGINKTATYIHSIL